MKSLFATHHAATQATAETSNRELDTNRGMPKLKRDVSNLQPGLPRASHALVIIYVNEMARDRKPSCSLCVGLSSIYDLQDERLERLFNLALAMPIVLAMVYYTNPSTSGYLTFHVTTLSGSTQS